MFYMFRNLREEKEMTKNHHHCGECGSAPCANCYTQLHLAFCLAEIERKDGSKACCGERFLIKSDGGCGKHKYNQDGEVNKIYKKIIVDKTDIETFLEELAKAEAKKKEEEEEKDRVEKEKHKAKYQG